jgi:HEPN domain-containing protein
MAKINNKKLAIEWLKSSYYDLENIKYIINVEYLTHIVAFHSQQSIEKSFKTLIVLYSNKLPKQHDLLKLHTRIKDYLDIKDENILEDLNELYIDSRYPGDMGLLPYGKPTIDDAKEFYEFANSVFDRVCKILEIDKQELF